jgi:hypothetical protein
VACVRDRCRPPRRWSGSVASIRTRWPGPAGAVRVRTPGRPGLLRSRCGRTGDRADAAQRSRLRAWTATSPAGTRPGPRGPRRRPPTSTTAAPACPQQPGDRQCLAEHVVERPGGPVQAGGGPIPRLVQEPPQDVGRHRSSAGCPARWYASARWRLRVGDQGMAGDGDGIAPAALQPVAVMDGCRPGGIEQDPARGLGSLGHLAAGQAQRRPPPGRVSAPVSGVTPPPPEATGAAKQVRARSRNRYGRALGDIEADITGRRRPRSSKPVRRPRLRGTAWDGSRDVENYGGGCDRASLSTSAER